MGNHGSRPYNQLCAVRVRLPQATGQNHERRLVVSEEPILGLAMSEADVIREVFRLAAVDKKSGPAIATRLNVLRIPCAYVRDASLAVGPFGNLARWPCPRLLPNKTYMGIHEYGKRSKKREPIKRAAPAIVSEDTWQKAQKTLSSNFLFGKRSARNKYLLRGLVKCGLCGRTYIGSIGVPHEGKVEFYYKGNGAHSPAVYLPGERCRSKAIRGDLLEQQVWSDIETFLRNPEPVLEQLHTRLEGDVKGTENIQKQVVRLEGLLEQKTTERSRLLSLYRRGRLSDSELDAQMDEIAKEKAALETQVSELRGRMRGQDSIAATVSSAQELLAVLRKRLDAPISWEVKRRIVEVLVAGIRIDTFEDCGVKQAKTTVTYRFSQPEQAMALMLSESYSGGGRVVRIQPS